ncbi:MAG TPA: hypothetical protein VJ946_02185, partial [Bacteroidales bacterium]|nr:hypothetical protein [Bacteroidales bacterium]
MTILAILGIWDVVNLENILRRSLTSLFVIFVASVIVLFIFSVMIKDNPQAKKSSFQQKSSKKEEQPQ